mgnify:CR=1 FL=1
MKKIISTLWLVISCILLCACQRTPDKPAVIVGDERQYFEPASQGGNPLTDDLPERYEGIIDVGNKNVKIKINSHKEFLKATKLLIKSGFVWGGNGAVPVTAPYLYTYDDGTMLVDYFDVEGADVNSVNSAQGYFNQHVNKEITVTDLFN